MGSLEEFVVLHFVAVWLHLWFGDAFAKEEWGFYQWIPPAPLPCLDNTGKTFVISALLQIFLKTKPVKTRRNYVNYISPTVTNLLEIQTHRYRINQFLSPFFPKNCTFFAACGELKKNLTLSSSLTWFMLRFREVFCGLLFIFKDLDPPNHILPSG